ncbi:MAG TPA: helix-turn-helix transcriptional regulator [Chroococcidiopsis sp.]
MKFSKAFREAMFRFKLKGSDIAERSGLTTAQVSQFRNGKNLRIDSLEKILDAMPQEARDYMLSLIPQPDPDDALGLNDGEAADSGDDE